MKLGVLLLVALALVAGCSAPSRFAVIEAAPGGPALANIALGPSAEVSRIAAWHAARSDWPSVETGYRVDDITLYMTATYDSQAYYDRFGSLYREAQTIRTGVRVR